MIVSSGSYPFISSGDHLRPTFAINQRVFAKWLSVPIILVFSSGLCYCGFSGHGLPPHLFLGLHLVGGVRGSTVPRLPTSLARIFSPLKAMFQDAT